MRMSFRYDLKGKIVAVAVSGGSDSMALLHAMCQNRRRYGFTVAALNVEHGIRGDASKNDSLFVKNFCDENRIPLKQYSVNSTGYARQNKLTIEQAARELRYDCFFNAIAEGFCDAVATAHHSKDNAESILFNLFRGSSLKGLTGITEYSEKIIRPLLYTSKEEIDDYVRANGIPFVTDQTNFCTDYSRNYIRLSVLPVIEKAFPKAEEALLRLKTITEAEDAYLNGLAEAQTTTRPDGIYVPVEVDDVLLRRATVIALKRSGVSRDWEKSHTDAVVALKHGVNGAETCLPCGVVAAREYDNIVFYKPDIQSVPTLPFRLGQIDFGGRQISLERLSKTGADLKSGLYIAEEKVPDTAVIRGGQSGDTFKKFGGGTKKLCDFYTDAKIPKRLRRFLPLIADGSRVLAIFGVAVSDWVKADEKTETLIKLT